MSALDLSAILAAAFLVASAIAVCGSVRRSSVGAAIKTASVTGPLGSCQSQHRAFGSLSLADAAAATETPTLAFVS